MRLMALLVALMVAGTAQAVSITTIATSDLTVSDSNNDGVMDSALSPTDGFIRVFGTGSVQRGVWEYDISSLTPADSVSAASVLFEDRGTTRSGDVFLYGFSGDGVASIGDGDLTTQLIGSFAFGPDASNLNYNVSLDTSFFNNLITAGASYAGIVMVSSNETSFGPGGDICSIESTYSLCAGTTGSALTLDFSAVNVPEPATLALLALGLVGVRVSRRA